jgi:hypothetical protein
VPDAFEAMPPRADDGGCLLPAGAAPARRSEVVRHDLQRVQHVIEVLDLRDRPKSAERRADGLTQDRRFANSGVGDADGTVLFLQARASLVDVAELADVLAEDDDSRIALQREVETVVDDLEAVE